MATTKKPATKKPATKATPAKKAAPAKKAVPAKKAAVAKATPAKKAAEKKPAAKRVPNEAFMRPVTPSAALSAVVGSTPLPRTEVTKKVWDYIKKNNLQDEKNRRMINADDKLKPIFGGKKQVNMFELTKLVSNNLS